MDLVLVASFLLFMGAFAGIGLASMWVKEDTTDDYLVAGRGMHPALAALSAVSTWNSGYMFIGFIGFTYTMGYSIIWIGLGSMEAKSLHGFGCISSFNKQQTKEEFVLFPLWFPM